MIIHCRDAQEDLLPMLRAAAARGPLRGVLHAFSGDAAFAAECLALGLYVSFAGNVTYSNKKFEPLRAAARTIPDDRLLDRDRQPLPRAAGVSRPPAAERAGPRGPTAALLAELRGVPLEQLAAPTTANARRLFRLPASQE